MGRRRRLSKKKQDSETKVVQRETANWVHEVFVRSVSSAAASSSRLHYRSVHTSAGQSIDQTDRTEMREEMRANTEETADLLQPEKASDLIYSVTKISLPVAAVVRFE